MDLTTTTTTFTSGTGPALTLVLAPRSFVINNASGTPEVINPTTEAPVPQGAATDGGGTGFDVAALIWLAFSFAVGAPMALAGIRLWRVTTGVGTGLAAAVCSWTALINSTNNTGVPDVVLTAVVLGFFGAAFAFGAFEVGRVPGVGFLGALGGVAFGVRVVLLRPGLLVSDLDLYGLNWAVLFGSASVGTFLVGLGVDLVVNQQSALTDLTTKDIVIGGYTPPLSTQIQLGVSLGLTPLLAFAQHKTFKQPFSRKARPESITSLPDFLEEEAQEAKGPASASAGQSTRRETHLLFNLWETMKSIEGPMRSRFSI
ncbi:hypothetical protein H0H92_009174 [Tricholoma furcatifolium]|nr:hypothetical protein H0H92_009174 [Tricholoma furcatifolium]